MKQIYRTTINGQILESDSLRQLLARAVAEKRGAELRAKAISSLEGRIPSGPRPVAPAAPSDRGGEKEVDGSLKT